jgi:hypothetical protein
VRIHLAILNPMPPVRFSSLNVFTHPNSLT